MVAWPGQRLYYFLRIFVLGFLPFLLSKVSKPHSSWKPAFSGVLILGGMLGAALVLAQAVFGWERLIREEFPILPLVAGTDLPGDVLARFDVLWIALLIMGCSFPWGVSSSMGAISWKKPRCSRCGTCSF